MPAVDCDMDHRIPVSEGGPTEVSHLAPVCRHDHDKVRHKLGWVYRPVPSAESGASGRQLGRGRGEYQWTSRLGHTYTTSGQPP